MRSAHLFHRSSRLLAAGGLLALSGCASQAVDRQLAAGREAVEQARMAGAEQAAPADFDAAVDKLHRARLAADSRDNGEAMRQAERAEADARLARARTDAIQARLAAAEMTKSNEVLRTMLQQANQNQRR